MQICCDSFVQKNEDLGRKCIILYLGYEMIQMLTKQNNEADFFGQKICVFLFF